MEYLKVILNKWIAYVVVLIIIFVVIRMIMKDQLKELRTDGDQPSADGNGSLYYLGRGSESDTIETLLQRTSWAAYLTRRTTQWERAFLVTIIILVLYTLIMSFGPGEFPTKWKLPSLPNLLVMGIIVFLVVYHVPNFMYVHGDIYNDYNIRNNMKLLANKLNVNVDFGQDPPKPTNNPPDRTLVMS